MLQNNLFLINKLKYFAKKKIKRRVNTFIDL